MESYNIKWFSNKEKPIEDEQVLVCILTCGENRRLYYVLFWHEEENRFYHDGKPSFILSEVDSWIYLKQLRHLI